MKSITQRFQAKNQIQHESVHHTHMVHNLQEDKYTTH